MKITLGVAGVIALLLSLGTCTMAKGALHEIEGLIWLVIAAVCLAGAGIIEVVSAPRDEECAAVKKGELLVCTACKGSVPRGSTRCRHCGATFDAPSPSKV